MGRVVRLGLLGGTFDPPHIGHLWLAEAAFAQLELDRVLFLPVGEPPHKKDRLVTAVSHRLAMVKQAVAPFPHFAVDCTDIERPLPHTTATLIPLLQKKYAPACFWLLMGSDSLIDIPNWSQPKELIGRCQLAVLPRPHYDVDWAVLETAVPGIHNATTLLEGPQLHLSATALRAYMGNGRLPRHLIPTPVLQYITTHHLYQAQKNPA
ncbi:MAG: nicotinate-nucleotide adenylyltransferase [Candidatus Promineifilaceae bacterium]